MIEDPNTDENKPITGTVFNIQLHSTEDGPGIRTSIFLKGCPMRCPWCHNPEGIKRTTELIWHEVRCIGAKDCLEVCPQKALTFTEKGIVLNRALCDCCGACEKACPTGALEVVGQDYTVDEMVGRALQDRVFYKKSGGGVTLSGGEASLQVNFSIALMEALKKEGVHLALDTCGGTKWKILKPLVNLSDLVLYDLKLMDRDQHLNYTGIPLALVLENAKNISSSGKPMWVRTPIIPGYNDTVENIRRTARFIRDTLPTAERYDLLAFNNTCSSKYQRLGLAWDLQDKDMVPEELMIKLSGVAEEEGLPFVHWSGLTKSAK